MGRKFVLLLLQCSLFLWCGVEAFIVTKGPLLVLAFARQRQQQQQGEGISSDRRREFASAVGDGTNSAGDQEHPHTTATTHRSCIRGIRSRNLGGVVSARSRDGSSDDVVISFPPNEQLITITGETGTGKSLLFARVMELITGGNAKGFSSLIVSSARGELHNDTEAFAQVELELHEPWCSAVDAMLQPYFAQSVFHSSNNNTLVLRRTLLGRRRRITSTCTINGRTVPLKVLTSLAAPLLKVVDAAAAASALVRPEARLAVLDTAVDPTLLRQVQRHRALFRQCQRERQRLERDIANLPYDPAEDSAEMLQHWIDELDAFSERVTKVCRSVAIRDDASFDDDVDDDEVSTIRRVMQHMAHVAWDGRGPQEEDADSTPTMHSCFVQLRNELRSLDEQMVSTRNAISALSLLSVPNSAATALEQARKFLLDISTDDTEIMEATETSHEYLNRVEDALTSCTRFLEDDDKGLLQKLESNRANYPISVDQLEEILFEWGTLARKHGIQPERLPACHSSLRNEQDGGDEARARLPRLQAAETAALEDLDAACADLHQQREQIARDLGGRVTERLGSLGMEESTLHVHVMQTRNATDALPTGYDAAHFIIEKSERSTKRRKQGEMSSVASSGEKARLLLAIECVLPGSVAAATTASTAGGDSGEFQDPNNNKQQPQITLPPPVAVLYDEIDAHVGGQAAVALSHMLRDQAEQSSQVLAITHSPPVAAVADLHVVVQKEQFGSVCAKVLNPTERRQELARMASGNVAAEEALLFADALLREGVRNGSSV